MKQVLTLIVMLITLQLQASNGRYRLILRDNPSTTMTIGWDQTSGSNPRVYYGTVDHGTNYNSYTNSQGPDRIASYRGMNNHFVRLTGLQPDTAYYFVIRDSEGTSERFWFKTAPADNSRLSFIAGGDSRNNRTPRQNANRLVAKLKPHAVLFGGDMTDDDTNSQWQTWFNDWQLTIANDGRMFPIIAARGNHEGSNNSIYHLFDVPSTNVFYAITFGNNLIRTYTLNTEISISGNQTTWLRNDLVANNNDVLWKMAQYHKPMRPHVSSKSEGNNQYSNWADLFYDYDVSLVVECDAHTVKSTWPLRPTTGSGSDEGFIRDDENGTVYVGEGCWGAPLRTNDDNKDWTRNSGRFNQFKWIFVDENAIETRTIKVDNASQVGEVSNSNVFQIPSNLDIWNPSNGSVVRITKDGISNPDNDGNIDVSITSGIDDVEERQNGDLYTDSSDLELVYDALSDAGYQTIGLRFRGVNLPKNATVTSAYLQFTADEGHSTATELEISLHDSGNSPVFSNTNKVSNRSTFSNKVTWSPGAWNTGQSGSAQRTPDLKGMVQQLANKTSWASGNNLSFIIKGKGAGLTNTAAKRVAEAYEGDPNSAVRLIITYDTNATPDTYTLTTNVAGQGTVTGAGTYEDGTQVTVQATPANGWEFTGWSGALSGAVNPTAITMNSNQTVTANFEEVTSDSSGVTVVGTSYTDSGSNGLTIQLPGDIRDGDVTFLFMGQSDSNSLNFPNGWTTITNWGRPGNYNDVNLKTGYAVYRNGQSRTVNIGSHGKSLVYAVTLRGVDTNNPVIDDWTMNDTNNKYLNGDRGNCSYSSPRSSDGRAVALSELQSEDKGVHFVAAMYDDPQRDITIYTNSNYNQEVMTVMRSWHYADDGLTVGIENTNGQNTQNRYFKGNVCRGGNAEGVVASFTVRPGENGSTDDGIVDVGISSGSDDVEEGQNGNLYADSSDLELVYDSLSDNGFQTVGLRFRGVNLPQNATVTSAYLQFTADEGHSAATELEVSLHDSGNSPAFSNTNKVSNRATFSNKVTWSPAAWSVGQSGNAQRTPDLKAMVQQLANKNTWSSGNNVSFIIKGKGAALTNTAAKRVAESYEGDASKAARLIITYSTDSTVDTYTLTTNTTGQGTVAGAGTYDDGTSVTVQATPANGWEFTGWSGAISGTTNPATITMNSNQTVTANFEEILPDIYTLTTTTFGQGTITGGGAYEQGTAVTVEAIPEDGWMFTGWSGALSGTTNPTTITMNSDQEIVAYFEEIPPNTFTLTTDTNGQGSVIGGGVYEEGTEVTIEAIPADGWEFTGWTGALFGDTNPTTITITSDQTVIANFEEILPVNYTLTLNTSGQGSVTGGGVYEEGTSVTIEATPADGWNFTGWSGDASGTNNLITITMNSDQEVTANFAEDTGNTETGSIDIGITNGNDDVEERQNGDLYTSSSDLELVYDGFADAGFQQIGLRFRAIEIPQGATISNAYLQFTADESHSAASELEITLHDSADSPEFSNTNKVSNRNTLSQKVIWSPQAWSRGEAGNAQRTPNLGGMLQVLINKNEWNSGNNISFIIKGKGESLTNSSAKRVADSYEGGAANAARLIVEFTYQSDPIDDICEGVAEWESGTVYSLGDKVTYLGHLFERKESHWEYLGPCGTTRDNFGIIRYPSIEQKKDFTVGPNPFDTTFNIKSEGVIGEQHFQFIVYDLSGKQVFKRRFVTNTEEEMIQMEPNITKQGLYLISITDENGKLVKTLRLLKR